MKRGGKPEYEIEHGKHLFESGAGKIWGWNTPAGQERVKRRIQWIESVCNLKAGMKVLECGCGTGIFTSRLAETRAEITAVDISNSLLQEARKRCAEQNVFFMECNLEEPNALPDEYFDAMVGISVLHHLDISKALPALHKKLKPGAHIAFSEPNLLNPINKYLIFTDNLDKRRKMGISPTEMAFYPPELEDAFKSAGFSLKRLDFRDFLHPQTPIFLIPLVKLLGLIVERLPIINSWSGSLWIHAQKL